MMGMCSQKCTIRQSPHCLNISVYLNKPRMYRPLHSAYLIHRVEYPIFQLIEMLLGRVSRVPAKMSLWFAGQWDCHGLWQQLRRGPLLRTGIIVLITHSEIRQRLQASMSFPGCVMAYPLRPCLS